MTENEFTREMQGTWPERNEEDRYLFDLAEEYHRRIEAYDRTVCTGPIRHGGVMPANDKERVLINRNALAMRRELKERAMHERGIDNHKVVKAIQEYNRQPAVRAD